MKEKPICGAFDLLCPGDLELIDIALESQD